jgi:hypothetical protein
MVFHPPNERGCNEGNDVDDARVSLREIVLEDRFVMRDSVAKLQQRVEFRCDPRPFRAVAKCL